MSHSRSSHPALGIPEKAGLKEGISPLVTGPFASNTHTPFHQHTHIGTPWQTTTPQWTEEQPLATVTAGTAARSTVGERGTKSTTETEEMQTSRPLEEEEMTTTEAAAGGMTGREAQGGDPLHLLLDVV